MEAGKACPRGLNVYESSPSNTQGGSPVRESRPPGSVRGVLSNEHPYRDSLPLTNASTNAQNAALYPARGGFFGLWQGDCWMNSSQWQRKKEGRASREDSLLERVTQAAEFDSF
jgi:hypothetical protein